jgi:hypothetical protein
VPPAVPSKRASLTQQQRAHAVACAHQVSADVLPCTDEMTHPLLCGARDPDRVQLVDHQPPLQPLGVAPVGLDRVAGWPLSCTAPRSTLDARGRQCSGERESSGHGLIPHPRRTRQRAAQNATTALVSPGSPYTHLAVARSIVAATTLGGEHPARGNYEPVPRHPMIAVGTRATPERLTGACSCAGADPHIISGRPMHRP